MSPAAVIFSAVTLLAVVGSALGEANSAAGEFVPQKRNDKTRMLAMFPRVGRTKSLADEFQRTWRGMKLSPRVGRSGGFDYDEITPWCSECVEDQMPVAKRANMAAFPRIGRRQKLAAFPRIGKRQQRLLANFPRVGRSSAVQKLENDSPVWQAFRPRGQDENYADYKGWNEAAADEDGEALSKNAIDDA